MRTLQTTQCDGSCEDCNEKGTENCPDVRGIEVEE